MARRRLRRRARASGARDRDRRARPASATCSRGPSMRRGRCGSRSGDVEEGWKLMEEVSGRRGRRRARRVHDRRASSATSSRPAASAPTTGARREWADAAKRWCERQSISGFPGVCRVHRAEMMRLVGTLGRGGDRADPPGVRGAHRVHPGASPAPPSTSSARCDCGWATSPTPRRPSPGARDRHGPAAGSTRSCSRAGQGGRRRLVDPAQPRRRELEPAHARAAAARSGRDRTAHRGRDDRARGGRGAGRDRRGVRDRGDRRRRRIGRAGSRDLAEGEATAAAKRFRKARQRWREIDSPYESAGPARCSPRRYAAEGDAEAARVEIEAARSAFERLGAGDGRARGRRAPGGDRLGSRDTDRRPANVRVHRHRRLDDAAGGDRRRGVERPPPLARRHAATHASRSTAARRWTTPATGSSWRSPTPPRRWPAPWTSSDGSRTIAAITGSRRRCGSVCTRPRPASRRQLPGWACTRPRGSARSAGAGEIVASASTIEGLDEVVAIDPRSVDVEGDRRAGGGRYARPALASLPIRARNRAGSRSIADRGAAARDASWRVRPPRRHPRPRRRATGRPTRRTPQHPCSSRPPAPARACLAPARAPSPGRPRRPG